MPSERANRRSSRRIRLPTVWSLAVGLPLAAFGLFVMGSAIRDVWQWQAIKDWVETPATLVDAHLEVQPGEGFDRDSTRRAAATYRYQFGGRQYQSDRVFVSTARDNIGSYQQKHAEQLERIEAGDKRLACYVNPANPSEAVLFRDFRPGLLLLKAALSMGLLGMGLAVIGSGIAARRGKTGSPDQQDSLASDQSTEWLLSIDSDD